MQARWCLLATLYILGMLVARAETPTTPTLQPFPTSAQAASEQSVKA